MFKFCKFTKPVKLESCHLLRFQSRAKTLLLRFASFQTFRKLEKLRTAARDVMDHSCSTLKHCRTCCGRCGWNKDSARACTPQRHTTIRCHRSIRCLIRLREFAAALRLPIAQSKQLTCMLHLGFASACLASLAVAEGVANAGPRRIVRTICS